MCGICGMVLTEESTVGQDALQPMMNALRHRGPDDRGVFTDANVGLGHVRLSIIDLSESGHQPMTSDDERYVLIYNGEIYNYIELREQLSAKYRFRTKTDTEVLLNAFREWGENCLDKLNGMFAFVLFDRKKKALFGARDRFGIKPFYYFYDGKRFIFASEIPALLTVLNSRQKVQNEQAIFDYLVFNRTDQSEETFFRFIRKLNHGNKFYFSNGKLKITPWYRLRDNLEQPFESKSDFKETLSSAIGLRLRSDVPVGVCLSGGLDSSSIVSLLLHDYRKNDINTFSAVYGQGVTGDESEFIQEFSGELSNMHFIEPSGPSLLCDLRNFVGIHGEPVPTTSPYAQYKVMELASKHVVVTLDGQGADEQLAGYHYFYGFYFKYLFTRLQLPAFSNEVFWYLRKHQSLYGLKSFLYFLLPQEIKLRARVLERGYIDEDFRRRFDAQNPIVEILYESKDLREALLNHFELKLEHLLKWEDRNSMSFSLEARVPFLDHRLVERTLSLHPAFIIHKGVTKYILREALEGILPEKIRTRSDKVGFASPQEVWFRQKAFVDLFREVFDSRRFRERGYFNHKKILDMFEQHVAGSADYAKEIWKWLNLELWFRTFIDNN